jgi:uncharacterized membrane protein (DUF2068 family)
MHKGVPTNHTKLMRKKRPLGLILIIGYKLFVAALMAFTSVALILLLKNHQTLADFSNAYLLESKHNMIDWGFEKLLNLNPRTLKFSGIAAGIYSGVTVIEVVGLWYQKIWATWLIIALVASSLPLEVYELIQSISLLKIVVFVVNLLILGYLSKHLR